MCIKCSRGSFSLNTLDNVCSKCMPNTICEGGDAVILD